MLAPREGFPEPRHFRPEKRTEKQHIPFFAYIAGAFMTALLIAPIVVAMDTAYPQMVHFFENLR